MAAFGGMDTSYDRNTPSPVTLKLIAQAEKIHMFRRMKGIPISLKSKSMKEMFRRHLVGTNDFTCDDVKRGEAKNSWRVKSVDGIAGSVLVTHIEGTDFLCDCIDYPAEYVCEDCKICIHMYMCSCREVDEFPSLICKHIHSVVQYGGGIIQKPDISRHIQTPHRSPGHLWPNPMIYRFNVKCGKGGSPKTLSPVSSDTINVDKELYTEIIELPENWESDSKKSVIAQEQIRNDIRLNCMKRKLNSDFAHFTLHSKEPKYRESSFILEFYRSLEIDIESTWQKYKYMVRVTDGNDDSSNGDIIDEDYDNSDDDDDGNNYNDDNGLAFEGMESAEDQPNMSFGLQKLIAQAWKINMRQRMIDFGHQSNTVTQINKRHRCAMTDFSHDNVIHGEADNTWRVTCSDAPEGSVLVTHIEGTANRCDCIDYPAEYVCRTCKICIHMYMCSCQEVDEFPSLICKHIHAVVLYGEGAIHKRNIRKHVLTPHHTPGHLWPNPIIYRYNIKCGKQGSPKTLVPVSSKSIILDEEWVKENCVLPHGWDTDSGKKMYARSQIKFDINSRKQN